MSEVSEIVQHHDGLQSLAAVSIASELRARLPGLCLGLVLASVTVKPSSAALLAGIETDCQSICTQITAETLPTLPEIAATREAYRSLGKDPSRYRGSAEALTRRIVSGKPLYQINTVVEINNLISLRSRHCVGSYDAARIEGGVSFRLGHSTESYKGIGKDIINTENLPVFADASGAFGSPTSDSERTMIRPDTALILTAIISFSGANGLQDHVTNLASLLKDFAGATIIETALC